MSKQFLSHLFIILKLEEKRNILNEAPEQQTQPTLCPECGGERLWMESRPGIYLINPQSKSFFGIPSVAVDTIVCMSCGYTAFYARNPSKLVK